MEHITSKINDTLRNLIIDRYHLLLGITVGSNVIPKKNAIKKIQIH